MYTASYSYLFTEYAEPRGLCDYMILTNEEDFGNMEDAIKWLKNAEKEHGDNFGSGEVMEG